MRELKRETTTPAYQGTPPGMFVNSWTKWGKQTAAFDVGQIFLAPQSCVNAWPDRYCHTLLIGSGSTVNPSDIVTIYVTGEKFPAYRTAGCSVPAAVQKAGDIIRPIARSKELILLLKNNLNLNMSQIAIVFGVARRSIYNWLEGAFPRRDRYKRLSVLAEVAKDFHLPHTRECATLLEARLQPNQRSIIEALSLEELDIDAVRRSLNLIQEKLQDGRRDSIASRLKARNYTELSRENREATLIPYVRTSTESSDD